MSPQAEINHRSIEIKSDSCNCCPPPKSEEARKDSPGVYIQGQRIFVVEKVRNVFVVGEAFSILRN